MTCKAGVLERTSFAFLVAAMAVSLLVMSTGPEWSAVALKLFGSLAIAAWFLSCVLRGELSLPSRKVLWAAATFIALSMVSAAFSPQANSWRDGLSLTAPVMLFVVSAGLFTNERLRRWAWASLSALVVAALVYGLLQSLGVELSPRLSRGNTIWISSFFYHYSHYSGFLGLVTPAAISIALYTCAGPKRTIAWVLALLLLLSLYLTRSWDVIIVTLVMCGALLTIWVARGEPTRRCQRTSLTLAGALCLAAVGLLSFSWGAKHQPPYLATTRDLAHQLQQQLADRGELYGLVVQLAGMRPFLGFGPGTFEVAFTAVREGSKEHSPFLLRTVNYAHNDLLQLASEVGVLAALSFFWFWLQIIFTPTPGLSFAERVALRSGIATLLLCGILDGNLTVVPATALVACVMAGMLHGQRGSGAERSEPPIGRVYSEPSTY